MQEESAHIVDQAEKLQREFAAATPEERLALLWKSQAKWRQELRDSPEKYDDYIRRNFKARTPAAIEALMEASFYAPLRRLQENQSHDPV